MSKLGCLSKIST